MTSAMDVPGERKSVFADTECAQALLDLAMSNSPGSLLRGPPVKSPSKRSHKKKSNSPPKRLCCDNWGLSPPQQYDPNCVLKLEANGSEELWREIVHRVRLDHSYSLPGQLKEIADQRQDGKDIENFFGKPSSPYDSLVDFRSRKSPVSLLRTQDNLIHLLTAADSSQADQENNSNGLSERDMYQPEDSKYKNFNLLLKCLTNVEDGAPAGSVEERKRKDSLMSQTTDVSDNTFGWHYTSGDTAEQGEVRPRHDSNANDVSGSSEEGLHIDIGEAADLEATGSSLYTCQQCSKTFLKKRYLIKHAQRMHPGTDFERATADVLMTCPNCGHTISKKNFKRHSMVCNAHARKSKKQLEMDLANCQFCGIRMRRHILVKHLAQEHCVDNIRDMKEFPELFGDMSDSDSSTLSGSEHEDVLTMGCGVCGVEILRAAMSQHVLESHMGHALPPKQRPTVTCQVCSIELPKLELAQHIANDHSVRLKKNRKSGSPIKVKRLSTEGGLSQHLLSLNRCKHSMLQRFLSDSSGASAGGPIEAGEQCQACVGSLVTDMPSDRSTPHVAIKSGSLPRQLSDPASPSQHQTDVTATVTVKKQEHLQLRTGLTQLQALIN